MANGWTEERRRKQAELIRRWRPWEQSTGPISPEGQRRVSRNAWTGGHRRQLRELARLVNQEVGRTRKLVLTELAASRPPPPASVSTQNTCEFPWHSYTKNESF